MLTWLQELNSHSVAPIGSLMWYVSIAVFCIFSVLGAIGTWNMYKEHKGKDGSNNRR